MNYKEFFSAPKTIAVVGLSDKPERISYQVASYLRDQKFTIIPINPLITQTLGILAYPSILAIPADIHIDVVDIFRKPENVYAAVKEIVDSGRRPVIWMQEGVISESAKKLAQANGMTVVMDKCMRKIHQALKRAKQI